MKITDEQIMSAYYKRWPGDNDHSEEKKQGVVSDVRRCWRARKRASRLAAFIDWGEQQEAVKYWMQFKRAALRGEEEG